jgi:flagellar L-ring protein precursor FlgH
MSKNLFMIIHLVLLITINSPAQKMASEISLFTDIKSNRIGQGITVLVMESAQASSDARSETNKKSDHDITVSSGEGLLNFLPDVNFGGVSRNDYRGDAKTSKRGLLKAKIAARIVGKNDADDYLIEGKRIIEINNEKETYILNGAVRQEDIMADNTVYSYNIYDAHIVYKGKGSVSQAQKAGIFTRILQWIF